MLAQLQGAPFDKVLRVPTVIDCSCIAQAPSTAMTLLCASVMQLYLFEPIIIDTAVTSGDAEASVPDTAEAPVVPGNALATAAAKRRYLFPDHPFPLRYFQRKVRCESPVAPGVHTHGTVDCSHVFRRAQYHRRGFVLIECATRLCCH